MKKAITSIELYCPFENNIIKKSSNITIYLIEKEDEYLYSQKILDKKAFYITNKKIIVLIKSNLSSEILLKKAFLHELHHFIYNKISNIVIHRFDTKNIMWFDVDEMCAQTIEYAEEFLNTYNSLVFNNCENEELIIKISDLSIIKELNKINNPLNWGKRKLWDF